MCVTLVLLDRNERLGEPEGGEKERGRSRDDKCCPVEMISSLSVDDIGDGNKDRWECL